MKAKKKAEEIAAERIQLVSSLLADGIDPASPSRLRQVRFRLPIISRTSKQTGQHFNSALRTKTVPVLLKQSL